MESRRGSQSWLLIAAAAVAAITVAIASRPTVSAQSPTDRWVGTWSTAEVGRPQTPPPPAPPLPPFMANQCPAPAPATPPPPAGQAFAPLPFTHFTNQTLRQVVHTSIGGPKARVVLSNAYSAAPMTIGAGSIALHDKRGTIQTGSSRALTFSGRATITIPANAVVYSDPVELTVPPMADLAIDLYLPGTTNTPAALTMHTAALQTTYISETGNHVGAATLPAVATIQNWFLLTGVQVAVARRDGRDRRIRRLDYGRNTFDARDEQQVARSPGATPALSITSAEDGSAQRRHRRQSRAR